MLRSSCDAETAEPWEPVTNALLNRHWHLARRWRTELQTTDFDSSPAGLRGGGSGQFPVALRSDDSLDLTLFMDRLPVLVRSCVSR